MYTNGVNARMRIKHASRTHVPAPIVALLFVLALASALVVRVRSGRRSR